MGNQRAELAIPAAMKRQRRAALDPPGLAGAEGPQIGRKEGAAAAAAAPYPVILKCTKPYSRYRIWSDQKRSSLNSALLRWLKSSCDTSPTACTEPS